jgi:hypothetical protein
METNLQNNTLPTDPAVPVMAESQVAVEEIDSSPAAPVSKQTSRTITRREETIPNPLLEDPYEWDKCTITLVYALLADRSVTVSVHNHKDDPIVRSFAEKDVPLPAKIQGQMNMLKSIWPDSTISATIVLLPKSLDAADRTVVVSVRANSDTPVIFTDLQTSLPFPAPIHAMLDELKTFLPTRALKRLEKDAKTKAAPISKTVGKTTPSSTVKPVPPAPAKTQLRLF